MILPCVCSHYSLMWGVDSPDRICRAAKARGYDRLALTDINNLYGLWPFLDACDRWGITPAVGSVITGATERDDARRAVCLVKNQEGYPNLCRLITRRHTAASFDLVSALTGSGKGLLVLTSHPGLVEGLHKAGVHVAAALPGRPLPSSHLLCRTARRLGVPLAAFPLAAFLDPADFKVHRLVRAIFKNSVPGRLTRRDLAAPGDFLAPKTEFIRRFSAFPRAVDAARQLAERLEFTRPEFKLIMPPPPCPGHPDAPLRRAAYKGAKNRYGPDLPEAVVERLEHELSIIASMEFSSYFLTVRDIVSQSSGVVCGRGSGAASLVAYCLGITNVCPVKHNLYFERFLNPGRSDPPDIDVDFAWDERDDVLNHVLKTHEGRSAMVAVHVLFQPRMAVRETAKVWGMPEAEISRVTRRLPWHWRMETADADLLEKVKTRPEARGLDLSPPWPEILGLARRIIDNPRYLSVHPGGMVITPGPIDSYAPVETAPKRVPVIQWDKDGAEDAGLVKIDLLGNRSLGVIRDASANVIKNKEDFDPFHWEPEDDFETRETVAAGRTMGCFYIESPAMRLLQKKTRVGDFEHLVIHSSIIRPAANEFIREYIRRLHGGQWESISPLLTDVLGETFGLMVYQEDVSKVARALAGFSHAEADGLRKVMSKKDRVRRMGSFKDRFFAGTRKKGVDQKVASRVWDMIMSFSGYSFCKPHSASYARVSFQAAYLKTHFPAEFMAAVISNQGGFYGVSAYVSEARRLGLAVLPPDVNKSQWKWTGEKNRLRVGLSAVKAVSRKTLERILELRDKRAFDSPGDFFQRVGPDETEAANLVRAGALDSLSPGNNRGAVLWELAAGKKGRSEKTRPLWGATGPPGLPPEDPLERMRREYAVLGFLCARHPLTLFADRLAGKNLVKAGDLSRHLDTPVQTAAWLVTGKTVLTKKGDPMEFLTFEDETGIMETTFFPRAYHRFCHILETNRPYLLKGVPQSDWGAVTLTVSHAARLSPLGRGPMPAPRGNRRIAGMGRVKKAGL